MSCPVLMLRVQERHGLCTHVLCNQRLAIEQAAPRSRPPTLLANVSCSCADEVAELLQQLELERQDDERYDRVANEMRGEDAAVPAAAVAVPTLNVRARTRLF